MDFNKLMNKFKCDRNADYTHMSMYPYGGLYKIPDEELEQFYSDYQACLRKGVKLGILERPKNIGPMLVDVDIAKESDEVVSLYTRETIMLYARYFQKYLKDYTKSKLVDCFVLEKPAYMKDGRCKNGFHLHFPSVWMNKAHRSLITRLVKESLVACPADRLKSEILDDSAIRNNLLLYGSRKAADQGSYKLSFVVGSDGETIQKRIPSNLIKTLSIRNNPTKVTSTILEGIWKHYKPRNNPQGNQPKPRNTKKDNDLITRCMESLDPSRADDYHDWIKVGCILFTIDALDGYQRWDEFSKQSYKYDEDYLFKTWSRFKEYDCTVGSLVYLAKQDDPNFSVSREPMVRLLGKKKERKYTRRQLIDFCRERKLHNYMLLTVDELCEKLNVPAQSKDEKYEKHCRGMKKRPREVTLVEITSGERKTFKSIYSAAKSIGRNPGSVYTRKNTKKTLKSNVDACEYKIEISVLKKKHNVFFFSL